MRWNNFSFIAYGLHEPILRVLESNFENKKDTVKVSFLLVDDQGLEAVGEIAEIL